MWRHLVLLLAPIEVDHFHREDWQASVRVDGNAEQARVGVDEPVEEAGAQVVQDSCL